MLFGKSASPTPRCRAASLLIDSRSASSRIRCALALISTPLMLAIDWPLSRVNEMFAFLSIFLTFCVLSRQPIKMLLSDTK